MTEDPLDLVAETIARAAHEGQVRWFNGEPYINHPMRVSENVGMQAKPVAWLHDVVEDGKATEKDLRAQLPDWAVDAVMVLTRRKGEAYLDYILRVKDSPLAIEVKLADLADNLSDLKAGSIRLVSTMRDKYLMAQYLLTH